MFGLFHSNGHKKFHSHIDCRQTSLAAKLFHKTVWQTNLILDKAQVFFRMHVLRHGGLQQDALSDLHAHLFSFDPCRQTSVCNQKLLLLFRSYYKVEFYNQQPPGSKFQQFPYNFPHHRSVLDQILRV